MVDDLKTPRPGNFLWLPLVHRGSLVFGVLIGFLFEPDPLEHVGPRYHQARLAAVEEGVFGVFFAPAAVAEGVLGRSLTVFLHVAVCPTIEAELIVDALVPPRGLGPSLALLFDKRVRLVISSFSVGRRHRGTYAARVFSSLSALSLGAGLEEGLIDSRGKMLKPTISPFLRFHPC